jgi:hypothetical protein
MPIFGGVVVVVVVVVVVTLVRVTLALDRAAI